MKCGGLALLRHGASPIALFLFIFVKFLCAETLNASEVKRQNLRLQYEQWAWSGIPGFAECCVLVTCHNP